MTDREFLAYLFSWAADQFGLALKEYSTPENFARYPRTAGELSKQAKELVEAFEKEEEAREG